MRFEALATLKCVTLQIVFTFLFESFPLDAIYRVGVIFYKCLLFSGMRRGGWGLLSIG